ncbi:hypothetical protein D3C76_1284870 [compost metagenome]
MIVAKNFAQDVIDAEHEQLGIAVEAGAGHLEKSAEPDHGQPITDARIHLHLSGLLKDICPIGDPLRRYILQESPALHPPHFPGFPLLLLQAHVATESFHRLDHRFAQLRDRHRLEQIFARLVTDRRL